MTFPGVEFASDVRSLGVFPRFRAWLSLPPGRLGLIRRVVGGLLLCVLPEVAFWSHGGPGPYHVPALQVGGTALDLPLPPPWLDASLGIGFVFAAIAMLCGVRSRSVPAVAAAILVYYGWRDVRACNSSYVQLLVTYLVALTFARESASYARRLIQCSLTSCYAFAVIQKVAMPEWREGYTLLEILGHGEGVRPALLPILLEVTPGPDLAWMLAPAVIGIEAFLAVGLWWTATRKAAMIVGAGLHLGFAALFPGTEVFAPVMFVGYLAFLEDGPTGDLEARPSRIETALAIAALTLMLAIPARIYLPPMRPWHLLTHMDHLPWTYSMFSEVDQVDSVELAFLDHHGIRHPVEPVGRMLQATADSEIDAMARHVLKDHPQAVTVVIDVRLTVNRRRGLVKHLEATRGRASTIQIVTTQTYH